MSEKWYYVIDGERQGPVAFEEVAELFQNATLGEEDYVWVKGFENWKKIKDIPKFTTTNTNESTQAIKIPEEIKPKDPALNDLDPNEKLIYIKTGKDRGGQEVEYGPFSITLLKRLYDENRINGKTYVYIKGMTQWKFLADLGGYAQVFSDEPPIIDDSERRSSTRSPFIARMFIEKNQKVFEGICRDISIGGMQVLVDNFPGQVGEKISINVHPENTEHHFVARGEIVRLLEGRLGFSFRFIDLKEDSIRAITNYLNQ